MSEPPPAEPDVASDHDHDPDPDAGAGELPCSAAIGEPDRYPPALASTAPERDWTIDVRRELIEHECDHGWSGPLRACSSTAADAAAMDACLRAGLAEHERTELTAELVRIDALAAKIAAARKRPRAIGCKQVVAAHYGDARWRGKLDGCDADDRNKLIVDSRARMTKSCTSDSWSARLRACIVIGGGETCFASHGMALSWGYPAAGIVTSLGLPQCDAYRAAIERITTCDKLPASVRGSLQRSFEKMQAHMASQPADKRAKLAPGCTAGKDAVDQVAARSGCLP